MKTKQTYKERNHFEIVRLNNELEGLIESITEIKETLNNNGTVDTKHYNRVLKVYKESVNTLVKKIKENEEKVF